MMDDLSLVDGVSSPIKLAQNDITNDNPTALKKRLNTHLLTEKTFVNGQTRENLLHYAVKECAVRCVLLLTKTPNQWSPDLRNAAGRTAAQMAEALGYLPIWFPLVANSREAGSYWSSSDPTTIHPALTVDTRSISYLLVYPHEILERPLKLPKVILILKGDVVKRESIEMDPKSLGDRTKAMQNDVNVSWSGALNYAASVNQLQMPRRIKDFLSYTELWPDLPRHEVPRTPVNKDELVLYHNGFHEIGWF